MEWRQKLAIQPINLQDTHLLLRKFINICEVLECFPEEAKVRVPCSLATPGKGGSSRMDLRAHPLCTEGSPFIPN